MSSITTPSRSIPRISHDKRLMTKFESDKTSTDIIAQFIEIFAKTETYPPVILKNRTKIIETLRRLDSMIEMVSVKESFISQMKLLLLLASKGVPASFRKMHAVFSGPPGVGKSTVAKLVADVWGKMGILGDHSHGSKYSDSKDDLMETLDSEDLSTGNRLKIIKGMSTCSRLSRVMDSLHDAMKLINTLDTTIDSKSDIYEKCFVANEICYDLSEQLCPCPMSDEKFVSCRGGCGDTEIKPTTSGITKVNYIVVGREDFVGAFEGHTTERTRTLLEANRGKIIIIEEAYLLFTNRMDSFGMEALTLINRYMDEYADDYIFIFTGYKEYLDQSIFMAQPGLRRRIQWSFEIEKYSPSGLAKIFMQQIENSGWKTDIKTLESFFDRYKEDFPNYGGDTERLLLHCQLSYANINFQKDVPSTDLIIDQKVLNSAFENFKLSGHKGFVDKPPEGMYL